MEKHGVRLPPDNPDDDWSARIETAIHEWEGRFVRNAAEALVRVDYDVQDMSSAVLRAATRKRPASSMGEQVRDALVWEAALRFIATLPPDAVIVFISDDSTFYDGNRNAFHPELQADLGELERSVELFSSTYHFLKARGVRRAG